MDATRSQLKTKKLTLDGIVLQHQAIHFAPDTMFRWEPETNTITYPKDTAQNEQFYFSLFHEIGHAKLMHNSFKSDLELLKIERSAWDTACCVANTFDVDIDSDHIESCMDTYRDWLYARSLCPTCKQCGLQTAKTQYSCAFCGAHWKVNASRLCRVTRTTIKRSP